MAKSRIVGVLSGVALLAGCGEGVDPSLSPSDDARQGGMSWEEFLAQVFEEPDTGLFIANGDEVFNEKELREFYELNIRDNKLILHRPGGVDAKWSDTQKLNLSYCVSTTFGNNYTAAKNAMAAAAAAWEAAGNVKFVYKADQDSNCTASNNNVLFDVRPVNVGGQYLARAFFPDSPRSQRNILIDNSSFGGGLEPWTLAGILRHEVGHALGFRHEHTRPQAGTCFEDNQWRELTTYDSASVMHYPHCNGSQTGDLVLTSKDIQGIQALYGAPGSGGGGGEEPPPADGTPVTETESGSVSRNGSVHFGPYSVVPGTTFSVTMTGSGDPDLYVRFGSAPTTSSYNCRPYIAGASESCNLTVPAGVDEAYIMVRGYSAGSFNLTINYTTPDSGGSGTPATDTKSGSVSSGQSVHHGPYSVKPGTTFSVTMTGSGDPDLYVRFGSAPTTSSYDCRPYRAGASESCSLTVPNGVSSAYIMVRGYSSGTYNLSINYTKP